MTWVDELIAEYADEKKQLELYKQTIDQKYVQGQVDVEIVSGMIGEMQYAISWMRRGRRPGHRRGIENSKVYNRSIFASLVQSHLPELSADEKRNMVDALFNLSPQERKCFILNMAYGLTLVEISDILDVSKSSVQTFLKRAKRKLEKFLV